MHSMVARSLFWLSLFGLLAALFLAKKKKGPDAGVRPLVA
jgi:hypothetical protein